jgi:hypothetical protein
MEFENEEMAKEFLEDLVDGRIIPSFIKFVNAKANEHAIGAGLRCCRFSVGAHTLECAGDMILNSGERSTVHVFVNHGTLAWPDCVTFQTDASRVLAPLVLDAVESAQPAVRLARQMAFARRPLAEATLDFMQELDEEL